MRRRIVGVQGAVQLISAVVAMRTPPPGPRGRMDAETVENILVIHDLCTNPAQAAEFAACLRELAGMCAAWTRIVFIDAAADGVLRSQMQAGGWERARDTLRGWLGCDGCDELLLGQNLLFLNSLLDRTFPDAEKSCYGDGLAINFSATYYAPRHHPVTGGDEAAAAVDPARTPAGWFAALGRWIRRPARQAAAAGGTAAASRPPPLPTEEYRVAFARKYLLFPNMLDEHWPDCVQLDPEPFIELFARIAAELHRFDRGAGERLAAEVARAEQTIVLLPSNFSETKRMRLRGEVACYQACVAAVRRSDHPLVVIKPHPRDSRAKIERIRRSLSSAGCRVEVLADPWTFYVPFESIYVRYIRRQVRDPRGPDIICVSSACLSLEYLFGQQCHLGFGAERVRRFFAAKWRPLRQLHEADLRRLVAHVRSRNGAATAA